MAAPGMLPSRVQLRSLLLGDLMAEGGEGRVFEVRQAQVPGGHGGDLVYKQFRRPRPALELTPTVSFLGALDGAEPALAARVRASSAWPVAWVVGDEPELALGALVPRAPGCFWLRHREGGPRLATLSYLASDPDRITVAYGTVVPAPGAAARVAVVYALARLLEAWQGDGAGQGLAVHGDLSAKNVLWSLDPVPSVYVLDCDGATVVEPGAGRANVPRPTTPNWDDPALAPGAAPTASSDRYTLGLTFLRVVGAAHFPLQARQRSGDKVSIDLELPRSWRRLPDMPQLWELCERSLSVVDVPGRPSPAEWAAALEGLLSSMGCADLAGRVRQVQGDPSASQVTQGGPNRPAVEATVPDVVVRPVLKHRAASTWRLAGADGWVQATGAAGALVTSGAVAGATSSALGHAGQGLSGLGLAYLGPRQLLRRCGRAWGGAHRLAFRLLASPGRRADGLRRLARALFLDAVAACVVLFLIGEMVSPLIGL